MARRPPPPKMRHVTDRTPPHLEGCLICGDPTKKGVVVSWDNIIGDGIYCPKCIGRLADTLKGPVVK